MTELWLCGRVTTPGELDNEGNEISDDWQVQGIFTTEMKAIAACRDDSYFLIPLILDESLQHECIVEVRSYFPLWEPDDES